MNVAFDAGLQPERTELSWRRTALSLTIGSLISLRLVPDALGSVAWVAPGIAGLVASVAIWLSARHRFNQLEWPHPRADDPLMGEDGRLLLATAIIAGAAGLLAVGLVLGISIGAA